MYRFISVARLSLFLIPLISFQAVAQTEVAAFNSHSYVGKKLVYIPATVWLVPDSNDYANNESAFSYTRMAESDNIVLFWAKEFGNDPMQNPDTVKRFNPADALKECERFYRFYVNNLHFLVKGKSVSDKYKILIYIIDSKDATAFGGGAEDKVGILWTPPARINKAPYGALAHEMGHCFQYLTHADGAWGFTSSPEGSRGQSIFEMTSQYMLWQVYPGWMTFENYHLKSFLKQTHYAFLHEENQYHSPYVLEYWSQKHGVDFMGKLWREAKAGEDAVMAYKRITGISQQAFNEEIFDAARRFITWDMKRIKKVAARYANEHVSKLDSIGNGWYRIADNNCPQNYGYNGIALQVPAAGTNVTLQFKGIAGGEGFRAIHVDKAGWRYGFLAVQESGNCVYGKVYSDADSTVTFTLPAHTRHLWLVVSGAPTEHWEHIADGKKENDEQWPYQIKLSGTTLLR
ncbi:hypothetical protein SAMN05421788_102151 [Filimonas lacunae]|uniref:Uncharacterized protein n=1 Tax=Filimonas lacunae TaxID=477680 RepID=A0A173MID1_9BACT|nr:DUF6055 domain-containing protein [Filimonas lacunae]BAV07227.1 avirulence protein [Filimonas lacunae]SIS92938.1 hypothetical protein SAMN05421788_102151 [Filimonas lacunae]